MSGARSDLEKEVQARIEADLGAEPDLLILRNSVGKARYIDDDGNEFFVPYGLTKGSPDLVCIFRVPWAGIVRGVGNKIVGYTGGGPEFIGIWLCFEVKPPEEKDATPEQKKVHAIWRRFGAIVEVVHSPAEARAVLERERERFAA